MAILHLQLCAAVTIIDGILKFGTTIGPREAAHKEFSI